MAKPVSDLVHNERTKLLANALDRSSTAALAVGVFGPIATFNYDVATPAAAPLPALVIGTILWLAVAALLHYLARRTLGGLR